MERSVLCHGHFVFLIIELKVTCIGSPKPSSAYVPLNTTNRLRITTAGSTVKPCANSKHFSRELRCIDHGPDKIVNILLSYPKLGNYSLLL